LNWAIAGVTINADNKTVKANHLLILLMVAFLLFCDNAKNLLESPFENANSHIDKGYTEQNRREGPQSGT
jgi:hypothetical protein